MSTRGTEVVRLVRGAVIAGRSYRLMLDSVLRGDVRGHQDQAGRWWVNKVDAERLAGVPCRQTRLTPAAQ